MFRCCLPCRGGSGSAAPATSPSLTPIPPINSHSSTGDITVKRKSSGKSAIELTTDGNESLIAAVKKHSLAETIRTSATTPISLKTLINDDDEDSQLHISAADIAAAKLALGVLPRKAEPETLSDTSISPTAAVLQLANNSASAGSLLSTTTAANTQVTLVANQTTTTTTQLSPTTPPKNIKSNFIFQSARAEQNSFVPIPAYTTATTTPATAAAAPTPAVAPPALTPLAFSASATSPSAPISTTGTITTSSSTATSTPSRCCCPPPQTSPLPHIKEEEESEQLLHRQQSANNDDEPTSESQLKQNLQQKQQQLLTQPDQLSPFTGNPSGSSDSCTSISAPALTTATTSSITGAQELTATSTPSPRIKHKFRKQHKSGWSRIILAPNSSIVPIGGGSSCAVANSSETLTSSTHNSNSAATVSAALAAAQTRLASSSATALATQPSSTSQIFSTSKMQAEQGSIGELQKYHSRYFKHRRHTLANVR